MNIEKYTERARGFIQSAQTTALGKGHQQFTPLHLLKVLLDDEEGLASALIQRAGGNAKLALSSARVAMKGIPQGTPDYLRAQDIAMVSETQLKKDKKNR